MALARHRTYPGRQKVRTELTFWACFAVVFALLSQALFPPQVMAAPDGMRFVLCSAMADAAPVIDTTAEKIAAAHDKSKGYQGLKCADCVVASVTAIPAPAAASVPVRYAAMVTTQPVAPARAPVGARAPPRPFSCAPPSNA